MVSLCKLLRLVWNDIDYYSFFGRSNIYSWAEWLWLSWGSNPPPFDHESDALANAPLKGTYYSSIREYSCLTLTLVVLASIVRMALFGFLTVVGNVDPVCPPPTKL